MPYNAKGGKGTPATRRGNGGWGGPAKGKGTGPEAKAFEPGNQDAAERAQPSNTPRDKAEALKAHLYHLAQNAEREETQVRAAEAWLNRHEGMPVSRNVTLNVDDIAALDDTALAERREALERELRASVGGTTAAADPKRPDKLVH